MVTNVLNLTKYATLRIAYQGFPDALTCLRAIVAVSSWCNTEYTYKTSPLLRGGCVAHMVVVSASGTSLAAGKRPSMKSAALAA